MRSARALLLVVLTVVAPAGCRPEWISGPFHRAPARPAVPLIWSASDPAELEVVEDGHRRRVHYRLRLTPAAAGAPQVRQIELRFQDALEGAKVDARGAGPRQALTLLDGKRIGGDTVAIAVPPFELDRFDLVIHHHRRPLPLVQQVRLGRVPADAPARSQP